MSSFEINIPIRFADADDVKEAFASSYGYAEQIQVGGVFVTNPITKEEFVKQKCVNYILDVVQSELIKNQELLAKENATQIASERAQEVTQWFDNRRLESIGGIAIYQQFPQVNTISLSTFINQPVNFTLEATEPNDLPVTFYFTSSPKNGIVTGTSPDFLYIPNNNFVGQDLILFKASNGTKNSLEAAINITVDRGIFVENHTLSLRKNQNIEIVLSAQNNSGNVLFTIQALPEFGQLTGDNPYIYMPNSNYVGQDSISFYAQDEINQSNIGIIDLNIVDLIALPNEYTINLNSSQEISLTAENYSGPLLFEIVNFVQHGTLTLQSSNGETLIYTPSLGFTGTDNFTFQVTDEFGTSNIAMITLNVMSN